MAEWNVDLPAKAVEGADTHVQDHNAVYDAIKEVRTNVDAIELTPGPKGAKGDKGEPGKDAEPQFTEEEVAALKALAAG
ncbi:hypothetical protein [Auritidibacter ignavus]|uniref:hypothetical protein n=1 Tax=Auritidibacter ignavus TaxID=678932 RepID=UPI000F037FCC|nr:hypothetical protein [Auritidibacter ignavus]NIH72215.1 hypothetical protein [Auritidibacter ignavus]RMX23768.1 hypothetical protein DYI20_02830 [Auritidibacter ignavus]WGH87092.1 hypothetical protein QDX24_04655 [Auritidibacter ignavus]WGH89376.1 hypothetical protein QDX22_04650 [Auritidibacter ignavus]WGH91721.1 hypothetical protein QDX23_05005 [Auritidibacter ignavus]